MDIWIKIKSAFEGKGAEDAKKAVDDIHKSAASSAEGTSKAFRAISAVQQATTGGLQGMGNAIKDITGMAGGFTRFLGPLALLLAAIAAVKAAHDAWIETLKAAAQKQREISAGNAIAGIDSLKDAYERLKTATDNAAKSLKLEQDQIIATLEVEKNLALAKNNQAKSAEIAKTPEGEAGDADRRRIELKYATTAHQIEADYGSKALDTDTDYLQKQRTANEAEIAKTEEIKRDAMERQRVEQRRLANLQKTANSAFNPSLSTIAAGVVGTYVDPIAGTNIRERAKSKGEEETYSEFLPEIKESASRIKDLGNFVAGKQTRVNDLKVENKEIDQRISLAPKKQLTLDTQTVAASTEADTQTRDINAAEAKKQAEAVHKARLDAARAAAEEDLPRLKRAADREAVQARADAARGRRLPGSSTGSATTEYMRVESLLKTAATDDASIAALLSRYIDAKKRADAQIAAAIKRDAA